MTSLYNFLFALVLFFSFFVCFFSGKKFTHIYMKFKFNFWFCFFFCENSLKQYNIFCSCMSFLFNVLQTTPSFHGITGFVQRK